MVLHFFDKKMTLAIFWPLVSGFSILQVSPRKCGWYVLSLAYMRHGNRWDFGIRIIFGCVGSNIENLPMASPWPPHGDGEVWHINPTTSTHFKQLIMSGDRLPCAWKSKGERFEWPPHGLPMTSPWPPHGDGEAPHGDGEVLHINPTPSTRFKQPIMSGNRLPCAWKQKGERFEWSPHGLPMTSPWPPHGDGEAPHGEKKKTFDWINAREWTFSRIAMD